VSVYLFDGLTLALRIMWKSGVSIEHGDTKIILDPQNNRLGHTPVFITHAHLDHSRAFGIDHIPKYSTEATRDLAASYGLQAENWQPLVANKKVSVDGIDIVARNSGHVLGSCEFEIITPEASILYTGDFNTEYTKTMEPAEPVPCDILIVESTFGVPNFVFPSEDQIGKDMVDWTERILKTGKTPVFQTDYLGNAQEVVRIFNESTDIPVVTHQKVSRINRIYESHGHKLDYIDAEADEAEELAASGNHIFITPKQFNVQNHPEMVPALVSGWALWAKHKAFPLSDHADFTHLMRFVEDCEPEIVLTCHSGMFGETLARYVEKELKIRAYPIHLIPTNIL
jgi:Cft2 family RNA processing exonuclease